MKRMIFSSTFASLANGIAQTAAALAAAKIVPVFAVRAGLEPLYTNLATKLGTGRVVTLSSDSSNLAQILEEGLDCR